MVTERPCSEGLDTILGEMLTVLDHGFIRVVDYMGNEDSIVQAARVSYGKGTKSFREDARLIEYLWNNKHTTPFEMCEIKLHCKMPIFVARQWGRHRTASINEYSLRYSEAIKEFYLPEQFKTQDTRNRQASADPVSQEINTRIHKTFSIMANAAFACYEIALKEGVSKEQARLVLPMNAYTMWYWKTDLHNLLHFLTLRQDTHAQDEIRAYADTISEIVKRWVPNVHKAWGTDQ